MIAAKLSLAFASAKYLKLTANLKYSHALLAVRHMGIVPLFGCSAFLCRLSFQREYCSLFLVTLAGQLYAMPQGDFSGYGQPQSRPLGVVPAAFFEAVEDMGQVLRGDAGALVGDFQLPVMAAEFAFDLYFCTCRGELDRSLP